MTKLLPGVRREDLLPVNDPSEGLAIAREAARRLAEAYGERLSAVVLFGSWVRGEAHEESDVDLLVVLDEVKGRVAEIARIVDVLFDLEADRVRAIEAFPVAVADADRHDDRFIGRALAEGKTVWGSVH